MSAVEQQRVVANDFARQWDAIRVDALAAIERVGRSGWLVLGDEVDGFERAFAGWWGVEHAVGVASGLDAIEIALRCLGVGPRDRVLTTPLTAFATTLAILRAGAEPVWCDVDASGSLDLDRADRALAEDPSIRALVPVHLYGHPMDPDRLRELAERHDVALVEDCAQSTGARRAGRPTGCAGAAAAASLYPTKNLGALGDGGVVLTNDAALAEQARRLRNYGQEQQYAHVDRGLNSRLDELQAAVLRSALLPRLDDWLVRRAEIADAYLEALADSPVLRPIRPADGSSANHLFPVEVASGDPAERAAALRAAGVAVGRHYPQLCSEQPACAGAGVAVDALAHAHRVAATELSLPIHPFLEATDVERVVAACRGLQP